MQHTAFCQKKYYLIGRLLAVKDPDAANAILTTYQKESVPPDVTDLSLLELFFIQFCDLKGIQPDTLRGRLYNTRLLDTRRLYVAAMVHLYNPQAYVHTHDLELRYGFIIALCKVLHQKNPNMGNLIREVVVRERVYSEFAAQVNEVFTLLKPKEETNE